MERKPGKISRELRNLIGKSPFVREKILNRTEGILKEHLNEINEIIQSSFEMGAPTECAIIFGSRARNFGRVDSDVDVVLFVRFEDFDKIDVTCIYPWYSVFCHAEEKGVKEGNFKIKEIEINLVCVDLARIDKLRKDNYVARGLAESSFLIYGEVPELEGMNIIEFFQEKYK